MLPEILGQNDSTAREKTLPGTGEKTQDGIKNVRCEGTTETKKPAALGRCRPAPGNPALDA
jgi:hypothetical protein